MKNSDSCDVYCMSNNMIKQITPHILSPFTHCFNLCLKDSYFPKELKISRVCPVFKKGLKNKPESYHPISIIPILGKLLEALVHKQISNYLETNNLLSSVQFGFRKNCSTFQALDKLLRDVSLALEDKAFA
uniref:Uncharacterized protein n=1 Tax=Homalodisca liturata TaxID=320908 RepID=A0A1B6J151_9HEMI